MNLGAYLDRRRAEIDAILERLLPRPEGPGATVLRAMRYAVQAGGKRLRPILAIAGCEACGGSFERVSEAAAALELIHTYSLIHDDLPAMDDDDLRRGKPTVHRAFGEAEAILAGDALNTLAFEWLATYPTGAAFAPARVEATRLVARASGPDGMVAGQIADLEAERRAPDAERLDWIHRHKTAVLLSASAELGAIHAGADAVIRDGLARYGLELGLAFQIADDVLDCTSTSAELGKTAGKDQRAGKTTYPALYGIEESRRRAAQAVERACAAAAAVGALDERLESLARFTVTRGG